MLKPSSCILSILLAMTAFLLAVQLAGLI